MRWVPLSLGALVFWGVWGVIIRAALIDLDWRLVVSLAVLGYFIPIFTLMLLAQPNLRQLNWALAAKAVGAGLVNQMGLIAFYLAADSGSVSVVVPLTALYPAVTLVGAVIILKESLRAVQLLGIALALVAGALLGLG